MQTKIKILKIIKWIYLAVIMIFVFGFIFIITYQWCLYVLLGFLIVVLSLYLTIQKIPLRRSAILPGGPFCVIGTLRSNFL